MLAGAAARLTAIIATTVHPCRQLGMMVLQQQQQSQPVSALRGGGDMMGTSPGHGIVGLKITAQSEALAVIIPVPHHKKRLHAPGLLKAHVSNDNEVANAEDVVTAHPLGYIVPVQASADDVEPITTEIKGVGLLQEGSSGGGADVEMYVTSTNEANRNGETSIAPLEATFVDSAKTFEEVAFPMEGADTRVEQQQQQQQRPPGWMETLKSSGRKLLLVAKTSAHGVVGRGLTTKDLEKMCAYVEDTTPPVLLFYASVRFQAATTALLASLVAGAAARAVVSAAWTSRLSEGTTSADIISDIIGSSGTSEPGDSTDNVTWMLVGLIANVFAVTVVGWIMWLSGLWILTTVADFARTMGMSRRSGSSGSPNIQTAGADAGMPDAATPNAATNDAATPDATTPDAAMPDAPTPDAAMPDAATPNAAMPDAATPNAAMPDPATLDAATPNAAMPDPATLDAATPNAATPNAATPNAATPNAATPNAATNDAATTAAAPAGTAPSSAGPEPPRWVGRCRSFLKRFRNFLKRAVPNCIASNVNGAVHNPAAPPAAPVASVNSTHASAMPQAASDGPAVPVPDPTAAATAPAEAATASTQAEPPRGSVRNLLQCLGVILTCTRIAVNVGELVS